MSAGAGLSTPAQASTGLFTQSGGGLFQSPQTAGGAGGGLFSQGGSSVGGIGRSLAGGIGAGGLGGAGLGGGGLGLGGMWFLPTYLFHQCIPVCVTLVPSMSSSVLLICLQLTVNVLLLDPSLL